MSEIEVFIKHILLLMSIILGRFYLSLNHIQDAVNSPQCKPIKVGKQGPKISHLVFADDLILFGEENRKQAEVMDTIMKEFCDLAGQKVITEKSIVFVSPNIPLAMVWEISSVGGIQLTDNLEKYLGVPVVHVSVNKNTYHKVRNRLAEWKATQ